MKFIILVSTFVLFSSIYSYSQNNDGGQPAPVQAPAAQTQPQSQQPSDYPDYIVKPKEDLNPYGMSSLGESTTDTSRDAAGTLGTGASRPSNMELNKEIQGKRKEQLKEGTKEEGNGTEIDYETAYPTKENYTDVRSTPVKTKIYRWTDDEGVTHVTNDLGSVPGKYMDQVTGNTKSR